MKCWLHPEAEADLREAAHHYRDQEGSALSQAFLAEFEHSVSLLLTHPRLGALWRHGKRRFPTRRFPFSIIHTMAGDQLRILAAAHHSSRPGYWRGRK